MSSRDAAVAAAIVQVATAYDGVVLGIAFACFAAHSWIKYFSSSSALVRIRSAPGLSIPDLRSLLGESDGNEGPLVVLRGSVLPKSDVKSSWWSSVIVSSSGDRAVIIKKVQTCIYNEWRGIFGWSFDVHAIFSKCWKQQQSCSLRSVPFVLIEDCNTPRSGHVNVKLDGSSHPLPLTTVHHHLHPLKTTPYSFIKAIFGTRYPIAILNEEKILPVGKEITVIGISRMQGKDIEIKPCEEIPYFLSDMNKDEMEAELAFNSKLLFWSGIILGTLSISILGYAFVRNWFRWKERRERRRPNVGADVELPRIRTNGFVSDEEAEQVRDGELCVICLARRRRSAFIPCGHLVCCPPCALVLGRDSSPKCPVCRQSIRNSLRIFDS